jgi:gluconate kinase
VELIPKWFILHHMSNYLISGLSGTGKSAVCKELQRRGYTAIEADEAFGFYADPKTGEPTTEKHQLNWIWDKKKVDATLSNSESDVFVCGGSMNEGEFKYYFSKLFTLFVDSDTLRHRLLNRTNNNFGKKPEDLARQLEWNEGVVEYAKRRGRIPINSAGPLESVVDEILSHTA